MRAVIPPAAHQLVQRPSAHQGVAFGNGDAIIPDLQPAQPIAADTEAASRQLLEALNRSDQATFGAEDALVAC